MPDPGALTCRRDLCVGEVCFEGEELLHVHHSGGEPELEQVLTAPSVAGLPEAVHLQFCDLAFHERSSP